MALNAQPKVTIVMTTDSEMAFLLRRAEEEAVQAIRTETTPAAAAHYELALLYSERARAALAQSPLRAMVRH